MITVAALFRGGMAQILAEAGSRWSARSATAHGCSNLVRADPPDVAVIDLRIPAVEGIDTAPAIRVIAPEVRLMLLSQHVDVLHALRLMTEFTGAVGHLLKDKGLDLVAFGTDVRGT